MTTHHELADWLPRAQRLADELAERGDLLAPSWHTAVASVPRHIFVPTVYEQDQHGQWQTVDVTTPTGLDRVYSATTLYTALADRGNHAEGVSSSTKPDLMARMLEILNPQEGDRVLEIGTGTGYNAALLSHRLGDDRVFSVDLDADLVEPARERLASIGYRPTLSTRDGADGLPEYAPYNRIIATCSVPAVPLAWLRQLAPGGLALVDLKKGVSAGNLALLRRSGDRLEGRFLDRWAAFMAMRYPGQLHNRTAQPIAEGHTRATTRPPTPWQDNRVVWFLAHLLGLPTHTRTGMRFDPDTREPTAATITAPDGSHAFLLLQPTPEGNWLVTENGPTPLWEPIENAYDLWEQHNRPAWRRLGLTVTSSQQAVWIDHPDSSASWNL